MSKLDNIIDKKNSIKYKSDRQEKITAKKYGGRQTIASGALPFDKSDVRIDKVRIECKRTDHDSIKVQYDVLEKLEKQCSAFEIPVLEIQIKDKTYYLIRPSEFDYIVSQSIKE